jgi:predicted nucleic acid-binding protein
VAAVTIAVTADTSVVVPALADWHAGHARAAEAVLGIRRLPAHVLIETVSVLTRLRSGIASPVADVVKALRAGFPEEPLTLDPPSALGLLETLARSRITGGRVYDALIGATAATAGVTLLTADRRALPTYVAVGAAVELID